MSERRAHQSRQSVDPAKIPDPADASQQQPEPAGALALPAGYLRHYGVAAPTTALRAVQGRELPAGYRQHYGLTAAPTIEDVATAAVETRGSGSALDGGVQAKVQGHLGADFSGVRVHQDAEAQTASAAMGARAFAYGSDVFLGPGERGDDLGLMAHELTHVAQQGAARAAPQRKVTVGPAGSPAEAEADQVSAEITGGAPPRAGLLVEPGAGPLGPGQMEKGAFLEQLRSACQSAAAQAGPQLDQAFARYRTLSAAACERAFRRHAPAARSAADYIPPIADLVRTGVAQAQQTGALPPALSALLELGGAGGDAAGPAATGAGPARAMTALAPPDSPAAIAAHLGPGEALDPGTAARMEDALGAPVHGARVHTDPAAARLAAEHNAHALTVGPHVAFAAGAYQPGTPGGDALLAHELAHVQQQAAAGPLEGAVQRKAEDASAEADADVAAQGAMATLYGGARGVLQKVRSRLATGLSLQRCPTSSPLPQGSLTPGGSVSHTTGATMDTYLSSSTALQAYVRTQIAAGHRATGHVHFYNAADFRTRALAYLMARTNPSTGSTFTRPEAEAFETTMEAFRDGDDIHVAQERGEPATVIHEAMHLYSSDAYRGQLGFNVNEGTTEWLMNIVCGEQGVRVQNPAYTQQVQAIRRVETKLGARDAILRAYFQGDIAGLRSAVDTATSAGTFDRWVTHMQAGSYAQANALMV